MGFQFFFSLWQKPACRLPFFLVTSVWYLQFDIGCFKQIQLNLGTYISSVPYDCTITIVYLHILQIMNVMHTCLGKVEGMDDSAWPADCLKFISVIIHALWCTVSDWRYFLKILLLHTTTLGTGKTTYFYRFRINAKIIFASSISAAILSRIALHRDEVILRLSLYCLRDIRLGISLLYSCSFANNNDSLSIPTVSDVMFMPLFQGLRIWKLFLFWNIPWFID